MKDKDTLLLEDMYKHIKQVNEETQMDQSSEQEQPSLEQLQDLTDKLHAAFCHENHTDGCGYYYGDWGTKAHFPGRVQWLDRTKAVVKKYGYEKLIGPVTNYHEAYNRANQSLKELRSVIGYDI